MNIWTEPLGPAHLPVLQHWTGRSEGALTPNDLPRSAEGMEQWLTDCAADADRLECMILAYDTPVGLAGLLREPGREGTEELRMLLCETNYNLRRVSTYALIGMLDRAFSERGDGDVVLRLTARHAWLADVLEQMGFSKVPDQNAGDKFRVVRDRFYGRKYLF